MNSIQEIGTPHRTLLVMNTLCIHQNLHNKYYQLDIPAELSVKIKYEYFILWSWSLIKQLLQDFMSNLLEDMIWGWR